MLKAIPLTACKRAEQATPASLVEYQPYQPLYKLFNIASSFFGSVSLLLFFKYIYFLVYTAISFASLRLGTYIPAAGSINVLSSRFFSLPVFNDSS